MAGVKRLTPEERETKRKEKAERLKLQGKAMIARAKQIEAKDKQRERKERTRELIEIGVILCQFHDRKKLLEYLKNPKYTTIDAASGKLAVVNEPKAKEVTTIFLDPKMAK